MDFTNEIWKPIKDWEGYYEVSSKGRIRSLDRIINGRKYKGKILSLVIKKSGYRNITLYKGKYEKTYRVHRLVAEAFIPNPENKPEVNHKIPIRFGGDDSVENLNWCTRLENIREEESLKARKNQPSNIAVEVYDLNGIFIDEFKSIAECERELNIKNVHNVITGKRKHSQGFVIKRKEK